jgi:hypothetical protein
MLILSEWIACQVAFLREFTEVGFPDAVIIRQGRNARTKDPHVRAVEVRAVK